MSARAHIKKLDLSKTNRSKSAPSNQNLELKSHTLATLDNGEVISVDYRDLVEEKELGSGEFGTVKMMIHKHTNSRFAVKILDENKFEGNENKNSTLMDLEVSIKIGNGSPFLVRFYGAMHTRMSYWILTEVMDTSVDKFCSKASTMRIHLPETFMAKVAFSILNALCYMKTLKIMHRDIKPSNMLLNSRGDIKVCDFGISGFTTNSICKSFKGCHRYMAPEKINITDKGYTIKSDIWSLRISLIEITTGVHPFNHIKGIFELTTTILHNDPPRLDDKKNTPEYCSFVNQCLMKDVDNRLSCDDLLLHAFVNKSRTQKDSDLLNTIIKLIVEELKKT